MRSHFIPLSPFRLFPVLAAVLLAAGPAAANSDPSLSRITPPLYAVSPEDGARLVALHRTGAVHFTRRGVTLALAGGQVIGWGPVDMVRDPIPAQPLTTRVHELIGPEERHRRNLEAWGAVRYPDVENADLLVESKPGGYAWSFHAPRASAVSSVALRYTGVERVRIDLERSVLVAEVDGAVLTEAGLRCTQPSPDGTSREVRCLYAQAVESGPRQWDYRVRVIGADPDLPLVIDPTVTWAARAGGSNTDEGVAVAYDEASSMVIVAASVSSGDFPVEAMEGHARPTVAVLRMLPDGSRLESVTYVGGTNTELVRDMKLDDGGFIYVAGWTNSTDLPRVTGVFDGELGTARVDDGGDGFVCALGADDEGIRIEACTYLGTAGKDEVTGLVIVGDELIVTGWTEGASFYGSEKPGNARDLFLLELPKSLGSADVGARPPVLLLGGEGIDTPMSLVAHGTDVVYIAGETSSSSMADGVEGLWQMPAGGKEGFIARVVRTPELTLDAWTFLGGISDDSIRALAVAAGGSMVCALGDTEPEEKDGPRKDQWPVFKSAVDTQAEGKEMFLTCLDPGLTEIAWSTLFGGTDDEEAAALVASRGGKRLYLAGTSRPSGKIAVSDLPGLDLHPSDALNEGDSEAVLAAFEADGTLVWSSYLGGSGEEQARGLAVRSDHTVLVVGATFGTGFPVTEGAVDDGSEDVASDVFITSRPGDISPPIAGTVREGLESGVDLDEQTETTSLAAHWDGFVDEESGIVRFEVSLGTSPDPTEMEEWVQVESEHHTFTGLSLEVGQRYFVGVRAINGAGDDTIAVSDGIRIVERADGGVGADGGGLPDAGTSIDGGTDPEQPGTPADSDPAPVLGWSCAAAGAGGAAHGLLMLLASVVIAGRRRRSTRPGSRAPETLKTK